LLLQKRPLMESSFDWSDTRRASALNDRTWPISASCTAASWRATVGPR
jgi:hypothetical protein